MSEIVTLYDNAEREALKGLPNRALTAFGCFAFNQFGYPHRVFHKDELWRYVDVMHEGRFEHDLRGLQSVSDEELELASWLARETFKYSTDNFGKPFTGRHFITRAILQLRGIRRIGTDPSARRVLELGPGSGYLSLLLAKTGYAVDVVEVSQAFALHQYFFFGHFLPESFLGFPHTNILAEPEVPRPGVIRQIPWWKYANNSSPSYEHKVITANHALAEFHPDGLFYLLKRFGDVHFSRWGTSPVIVADTLGADVSPHQHVLEAFNRHGWAYKFDRPFYFVNYVPEVAASQALEARKQEAYERTLERKIKKFVYLTLHERPGRIRRQPPNQNHDSSLSKLRQIFDSFINDEKTPDESYFHPR